jgi:hypothetical protein
VQRETAQHELILNDENVQGAKMIRGRYSQRHDLLAPSAWLDWDARASRSGHAWAVSLRRGRFNTRRSYPCTVPHKRPCSKKFASEGKGAYNKRVVRSNLLGADA